MSCLVCDKPATSLCADCNVAQYCNPKCQQEDWHDNHHLVCFRVTQPDLNHVNDLIGMMFDPTTEQDLKRVVAAHHSDPEVMMGIAGLLQSTLDDQEDFIGDREGRRERRRAKRRRRWAKKKHEFLRKIPGTRSYRTRRRYRRNGVTYGPYQPNTPEQFEAERGVYY